MTSSVITPILLIAQVEVINTWKNRMIGDQQLPGKEWIGSLPGTMMPAYKSPVYPDQWYCFK